MYTFLVSNTYLSILIVIKLINSVDSRCARTSLYVIKELIIQKKVTKLTDIYIVFGVLSRKIMNFMFNELYFCSILVLNFCCTISRTIICTLFPLIIDKQFNFIFISIVLFPSPFMRASLKKVYI